MNCERELDRATTCVVIQTKQLIKRPYIVAYNAESASFRRRVNGSGPLSDGSRFL